jgi:hypothetical protein
VKLLVILILKWAHAAPESTLVNFGDHSKLGGTRENWPKIGKNEQKWSKKADFGQFSRVPPSFEWSPKFTRVDSGAA